MFLLKGYAGTGKTTLIKGLLSFLEEAKTQFQVMAPTGRAAKIAKEKTGYGTTIHRGIYNFENLETYESDSDDVSKQSFKYRFPINKIEEAKRVIIIDEASMISSKKQENELFDFGTNILLQDIFTYAFDNNSQNKIIFVGDPAQLSPVGDSTSWAFETRLYIQKQISFQEATLTEVKRQENNSILSNSIKIRDVIDNPSKQELQFNYDNSFEVLESINVNEEFLKNFPEPDLNNGVIINYSNAQCFHHNDALRRHYFSNANSIQPSDVLLINSNNYHTYGVELFNGDFVQVLDVTNLIVTQSAPVMSSKNSERKNISITFRQITIRTASSNEPIKCYIIESLLNSVEKSLTIDEQKALYINFVIRFKEEQEKRKENGKTAYKVGSKEFKDSLKTDQFYNALRVKYGYAITCHKAQGGEWDTVFVDYSGRVSLSEDPLRWCYTATTRGVHKVFAINPPHFTQFSKMNFSTIVKSKNFPKFSLNLDWVKTSPFHNDKDHKCKSLKYWEVLEQLEGSEYKILSVKSLPYAERYFINDKNDFEYKIEYSHKLSGHFIGMKFMDSKAVIEQRIKLENILKQQFSPIYHLNYTPKNELLKSLHSIIQNICNSLDIVVTNVIHIPEQYCICYYFITDSPCADIKFFYNEKYGLTTAMPKCVSSEDDNKLNTLIDKLVQYAE